LQKQEILRGYRKNRAASGNRATNILRKRERDSTSSLWVINAYAPQKKDMVRRNNESWFRGDPSLGAGRCSEGRENLPSALKQNLKSEYGGRKTKR